MIARSSSFLSPKISAKRKRDHSQPRSQMQVGYSDFRQITRYNSQTVQDRHGLRAARYTASPMLTATGFVNGKWHFSTPYRIDTPQPITKKFVIDHFVGDPYTAVPNLIHTRFWRGASARIEIDLTNFIIYLYPFFENLPTGQTCRRISAHMIARTTRTRARMCLFGFR